MNQRIERLIEDVASNDLSISRDAIVRSALFLEWDAQGYLDVPVSKAFAQDGLYDEHPKDAEIVDLISGLKDKFENLADDTLRKSIIWALGRSVRDESLYAIISILNQAPNLILLCESTDALEIIFDRFDGCKKSINLLENLTCLVDKLGKISFLEAVDESHREKIIAKYKDNF